MTRIYKKGALVIKRGLKKQKLFEHIQTRGGIEGLLLLGALLLGLSLEIISFKFWLDFSFTLEIKKYGVEAKLTKILNILGLVLFLFDICFIVNVRMCASC